tara:strand:- start:117 stop:1211 length:1095 start_codon:yes stop_codon:yes gene_type:complete
MNSHLVNLALLVLLGLLVGCRGAPLSERASGQPDENLPEDAGSAGPGEEDTNRTPREGPAEHPEALLQGGRAAPSEEPIVERWEDEYFPFLGFAKEPSFRAPAPLQNRQTPVELDEEVLIPKGSIEIGDPQIPGSRPTHLVELEAYYIDRYEVSNERYQAFVRATSRTAPYVHENWAAIYNWYKDTYPDGLGQVPVVMVTWADADAYCRWAGRRLPSEYEWERAARGAAANSYPWGNQFSSAHANLASRLSGPLTDITEWDRFEASWTGSKQPEIAAVGSYPQDRSPDGVMDLAGNVSEWVAGHFAAYPGAAAGDRKGLNSQLRVARGNSWGNRDYSSTMAIRYPYQQDRVDSVIGFRCARDAR